MIFIKPHDSEWIACDCNGDVPPDAPRVINSLEYWENLAATWKAELCLAVPVDV